MANSNNQTITNKSRHNYDALNDRCQMFFFFNALNPVQAKSPRHMSGAEQEEKTCSIRLNLQNF